MDSDWFQGAVSAGGAQQLRPKAESIAGQNSSRHNRDWRALGRYNVAHVGCCSDYRRGIISTSMATTRIPAAAVFTSTT